MLTSKDMENRGIEMIHHADAKLPPVLASPDQINEVVLNLVVNARDAMPEGGTLTLHADIEDGDVVLYVSDTGQGIPEEIQDRIFEPFFTTKGEEGTGLGLSICYRILEEHNGEIRMESEEGKGTTFIVTLPRAGKKLGV